MRRPAVTDEQPAVALAADYEPLINGEFRPCPPW
jgi:hypothetical protein